MIPLRDQDLLRQKFAVEMAGQVKVDFFTQKELAIYLPGRQECAYCKPAGEMLRELASLTDGISLRTHFLEDERAEAAKFGVSRIPAIVIRDGGDRYLTFYGFPGGAEFPAFVQTLVDVSQGVSLLSEPSKQKLASLRDDILIQVFVTTSCPHCPGMAHLAYHLALESPHIQTEVTEVGEFPEMARRYNVRAVPLTVIGVNGRDSAAIPGGVSEQALVDAVLKATGAEVPGDVNPAGKTSPTEPPSAPANPGQRGSGLIIP